MTHGLGLLRHRKRQGRLEKSEYICDSPAFLTERGRSNLKKNRLKRIQMASVVWVLGVDEWALAASVAGAQCLGSEFWDLKKPR